MHSEAGRTPTTDEAASFAEYSRWMLLDLATSYAMLLGPQLHADPSGTYLACPRCGTWSTRLYVVALLGLACVRCIAASGKG